MLRQATVEAGGARGVIRLTSVITSTRQRAVSYRRAIGHRRDINNPNPSTLELMSPGARGSRRHHRPKTMRTQVAKP